MILSRRRFLIAAPAIVAVSSIMPISVPKLVQVKSLDFMHIEGFDYQGNFIRETIPWSHVDNGSWDGSKQFKVITGLVAP